MILSRLDKLMPRERVGLGLSGLLLLALAGDHLVVRPVIRRFSLMDHAITAEQNGLAYHRRALGGKQEADATFEGVKGVLETVTSPSEERNRMLGQIDDLARQVGLNLVAMKDLDPKTEPSYGEYGVEVEEFRGSMDTVLSFLGAVRLAPGMLRVTSLNLSPNRGSHTIKGSMVITKVMMLGGEQG